MITAKDLSDFKKIGLKITEIYIEHNKLCVEFKFKEMNSFGLLDEFLDKKGVCYNIITYNGIIKLTYL